MVRTDGTRDRERLLWCAGALLVAMHERVEVLQQQYALARPAEGDRVRLGRASYKTGTYEQLHWHPIEATYYVISGHATVRDFNGKEYEVEAGSIIYAPAGIAGAHEWEVKEALELIDIRACNETNRKIQYTVDKATKRSYIDLKDLKYRDAISFKSHY